MKNFILRHQLKKYFNQYNNNMLKQTYLSYLRKKPLTHMDKVCIVVLTQLMQERKILNVF